MVEVKGKIEPVKKIEKIKPVKKVYKFKSNFRGLDYINSQLAPHQELLKMTVRSAIGAMDGKKLTYKAVTMMLYKDFMDFISQFNKSVGSDDFLLQSE